jgi:DNA-binding NarL/FixJ family response regulator
MPRQRQRPARLSPAADLASRPRVLVVDDSAVIQEYIARLLAKEFTVAGAFGDAESLIDQWRRADADAIVLDISLPGLSGIDAAARLRQNGCEVPIVCCSVHEDREVVDAARAAGALGYVAKRELARDLVPALRAALCGHRFVSAVIASS